MCDEKIRENRAVRKFPIKFLISYSHVKSYFIKLYTLISKHFLLYMKILFKFYDDNFMMEKCFHIFINTKLRFY